jgi:translocation and assembly module TamB
VRVINLIRRPAAQKAVRYAGICVMLTAAFLAAAIVASVTVDLGPSVRGAAENQGSKYLERPMRIGRLSIHLLSGKFVIEDMVVDGLHPGDRPFFTARRIAIAMDWATAMRRQPEFLITSVELSDWEMLVEKWATGHSFPKVTRDTPPGPKRFTTTVKYLRAFRGQFTYEDHQSPWSIVCRNLDFNLGNVPGYHGTAVFSGGTVQIQNYKPFAVAMRASYRLDGPHVDLDRVDIESDGAQTVARGSVELGKRWPEQSYDFESRVQFPQMRDIFFFDQDWALAGEGNFTGKFHLFKGGHDVNGRFTSDALGWNGYRFPELAGALHWTNQALDVTNARAKFFGGDAQFAYSIKPLGQQVRSTSRFEASYENADLAAFSDFQQWRGLRFAGSWSGHNVLEWPTGRFAERRDEGTATVVPLPSADIMTPDKLRSAKSAFEWGPFALAPLPAHVPIAAELAYRFTADRIELDPSYLATERTHVTFDGSTAWGDESRFRFHVTSRDWQESDQVLAGLMRDFGSSSDAVVAIGGRGEFDGMMTGPFREARVEGLFSGEDLRAWDTTWGQGSAHIVYEDDYIKVTDGVIRKAGSEIRTDGLFSLATPRPDGGNEIDARFRVTRRDLDSLRHAFEIDEYPLSGLMSGEFQLTGRRRGPVGSGTMRIEEGVAYGEPIQGATASLRFDGKGVRLEGMQIAKGSGEITGAAYIGWDSTYSFEADGRRIPAGTVAFLTYPGAPLSGIVELSANGNGTFDVPRNDFKFRISNFAIGEEPVGQVTGDLALRGTDLSGQIDAASPRLTVTGTGRISLDPEGESEVTLRVHESAIDQYARLFMPRLPPSATAIASGTLHMVGELSNTNNLHVDGTIDTVDMRLFDLPLKNAAPVQLTLDRGAIDIDNLQLVGDDTRLAVTGTVGLRDERIGLQIEGDANLAILQGFFRDVRSSGRAEVKAAVNGPLRQPVFSGAASIAGGRIRHFSLPNALDEINGTVTFDARGVRLDAVRATMGGGPIQFGGRVGFDGYQPDELNVTVRGEGMQLRLFEGVRSTLDADLALGGTFRSATLGGTVMVRNALWTRRIEAPGSILDFARRATAEGGSVIVGAAQPATLPLRYDVRIEVPSSLRVETNLLRLVASADLRLVGTYDRPVISGHADIERGELNFEGRRYRIARGAIDFNNPTRTEPFFDIEAQTDVRVPGPPVQTYHINIGFAGTTDRLQPTVSSDPALPTADVLALLFSDVRRSNQQDVELRALQNPNQAETDILAARATQALTAPISEGVGKVVEETFGVDTFQLTPSFVNPVQTSGLNPTARLTIGKRVSDRVYLTFSRSLGTTINDQIVLLEYEDSDRLSWILSRNEDQQTYALEFRVRHTF